jgi:aspartyl-tRNA(Asn)/glutamyl-tRNA(Gln) amidotransferase subunit B
VTVPYTEALEEFEPVIGLETHVELGTASKMFCGCDTTFGAEPNTHTCPVCLGLPGALPVVNAQAIESTIRIGLALHCDIASWCRFARKNYFYPDMPKNFQTSQYDEPLCTDGYLDVEVPLDGGGSEVVRVPIERVHLEEDTGKSLHVGGATGRIHGASHSLVDYNRAGIPLVEIVTKPVTGTGARPAEVAKAYVTELRDVLRGLGVSDVRMEQGSLRCDVNVSLNRPGQEWGTRSETKNVNSLRSVERAVRSEVERQAARLRAGERIVQETRHFSEDTGLSTSGRSKEEATDYRYFPEPDLVPVAPAADWVAELRAALPEAPSLRRARLTAELGLSALDSAAMVNAGVLDLVLATVEAGAPAAEARNWWLGPLAQAANSRRRRGVRAARHPGAGRPGRRARRGGRAHRRPRPAGGRGRARRRGRPGRGRRGAGARRRLGRGGAGRGRRRRDRRAAGRCRQGPRRQGAGRRRARRRGHEGDAWSGRRRGRAPPAARAAGRPGLRTAVSRLPGARRRRSARPRRPGRAPTARASGGWRSPAAQAPRPARGLPRRRPARAARPGAAGGPAGSR